MPGSGPAWDSREGGDSTGSWPLGPKGYSTRGRGPPGVIWVVSPLFGPFPNLVSPSGPLWKNRGAKNSTRWFGAKPGWFGQVGPVCPLAGFRGKGLKQMLRGAQRASFGALWGPFGKTFGRISHPLWIPNFPAFGLPHFWDFPGINRGLKITGIPGAPFNPLGAKQRP